MQDDTMKTFKPQPIPSCFATEADEAAAIARVQNPSQIDFFCEEEIDRMDVRDRCATGITRAGWYFWNETWTDAYGPYSCRLEAEIELQKYCEYLNSQNDSQVQV